jgi:aconitase B
MERLRRQKVLNLEEEPEDIGEEEEAEEVEGTGEEAADLLNEPSYEVAEGETVQQAQDRIEAKYKARAKSPLKAIRAFCVLCMGAQPREVAHCTATSCVLYKFRFGRNPYQKRG